MADHTPAAENTTQTLSETDLTRISTNAATTFLETYHDALSHSRSTISTFFIPPSPDPPTIIYNGTLIQSGEDFQNVYESMPYTHYEIQSVNASVINPCIDPRKAVEGVPKGEVERNVSVSVLVSGFVRLYERKEGEVRGFSESLVLVPNSEEMRGRVGAGRGREWLAQSCTLRWVV